ncbi:hypothetical protein FB451DRAFT_1369776 [Mycena latifolia]|nr:hypothetical protein FB451DRAFT_1369776 [Mycena latifolia]
MPLHSLNSDVILHIFTLLDVFTILSISRANKHFRAIAFAKQLWISVVRDLVSRYLIDPPGEENLERLSTAELMQHVKRGVIGPLTWSPSSSVPPTLSRQIHISLEALRGRYHAEFLPEGRHILFYTETGAFPRGVECWEVRSGRRVWGWSSPDYHVGNATFDFRRGGSEAVVSLESYTSPRCMILIEADLRTGKSRQLLHLPTGAVFSLRPYSKLSGDFFVCQADTSNAYPFLLVNWRSAEFILFDSNKYVLQRVLLFSGHIGFSYHYELTPTYVHIHDIASLGHLWRPLSEFAFDNLTDPEEIPHITVDVPGIDNPPDYLYFPRIQVYVAESLVHDEAYELVFEATTEPPRPSLLKRLRNRLTNVSARHRGTTVSRYHLTLSPPPPPALQLKSRGCHEYYLGEFTVRSRYGFSCGAQDNPVVHPLDDAETCYPRTLPRPVLSIPTSRPQFSSTGAMMVYNGSRIAICYYV